MLELSGKFRAPGHSRSFQLAAPPLPSPAIDFSALLIGGIQVSAICARNIASIIGQMDSPRSLKAAGSLLSLFVLLSSSTWSSGRPFRSQGPTFFRNLVTSDTGSNDSTESTRVYLKSKFAQSSGSRIDLSNNKHSSPPPFIISPAFLINFQLMRPGCPRLNGRILFNSNLGPDPIRDIELHRAIVTDKKLHRGVIHIERDKGSLSLIFSKPRAISLI